MSSHKVAFLTAGGLAPCLSSAIGFLVEATKKLRPTPNSSHTAMATRFIAGRLIHLQRGDAKRSWALSATWWQPNWK